jgi:hypothetical protein
LRDGSRPPIVVRHEDFDFQVRTGRRESVHGITAQCEEFARTVSDVGCQKPA